MSDSKNTGHGHVYPRPDGRRARCGGPTICSTCALDFARESSRSERDDWVSKLIADNVDVLNRLDSHLGCAVCRKPLVDGVCPDHRKADCPPEETRESNG